MGPISEVIPPPFLLPGTRGKLQKGLVRTSGSEATALQAQMRWEGPFPSVICGCLPGRPYVPIHRPAKWNSWLGICIRWFFSQLLQLFVEGWGWEEQIISFVGWDDILYNCSWSFYAVHSPSRPPLPRIGSQGHSRHGAYRLEMHLLQVLFSESSNEIVLVWIQANNSW